MQLKKFALRGMIILAVVIALCVLFSGTLRTLTTAKVKKAVVKSGKIENTVDLKGKVTFPDEEEMTIRLPEGLELTVTKVHAAAGQKVKKGEKLLSTEVTDAAKTLAELQEKCDAARVALDTWERKHGDIRLSRSEKLWIEAFDAAREAEKAELDARLSLLSELSVTNVSKVTEKALKKAGEKGQKLYEEWQTAVNEMNAAQKKQAELNRYAVEDDVWKTLQDKRDEEKKLEEAENQMTKIRLMQKQLEVIAAPHDGYVIEIKVEKDSKINGESLLALLTPEGIEPVLRMDTREVKQTVQKGTIISIPLEGHNSVGTKVTATGVMDTGAPYADAAITADVIYELGSVSTMMKQESIDMKLVTRAKETTCLITAAAVQKNGEDRFVYIVRETSSPLGGTRLTVYEQPVKVLAETADWVSVEDDLSYGYTVVYMADRDIHKGDTVMLYD